MFKIPEIIAIGDMSIDVFLEMDQTEAEVHCALHKTDCKICFSYADKIPVAKMTRTIGGNAANVAVGSRRLGYRSALVTTLGKDSDGELILDELWHEKVNTAFIKRDKRTNLSTVINYLGERTIFVYHEPREYHLPRLPKADYIYLTSMRSGWEKVINPLSDYLDRTKTKFAYNPGTYQLRAGAGISKPLLERCDIFFVNKQEASLYTSLHEDTPMTKFLEAIHELGPRIAVITDGPNGSYASDGKKQYQLGIFDAPVVERTGTGDAFAAGFTVAIYAGKDLGEAMRWGSFESASVLQCIGPQAGLLHVNELRKYCRQYKTFKAKLLTRRK